MKTFTKVMLSIAGVFAAVGVICTVAAFAMGFSSSDIMKLIQNGNFSIKFEDGKVNVFGYEADIFEENEVESLVEPSTEEAGQTKVYEIEEVCQNIDLEFGAGVLELYYDDVENIVVKATDLSDIAVSAQNGTLKIGFIGEANIDVDDAENRKLEIIIPSQMQFDEVDMQIGASQAEIKDLISDEVAITVGAGQATIEQLTVNKLDVEAGMGQVSIFVNGAQEEYNYHVECGIGSVKVGDTTYGGLAAEDSVRREGATKEINVECGVGEVTILFQNII